MRTIILLIATTALCLPGCRDNSSVEGKVTITSTNVFAKTKAMKSPPPQKPAQ
jgi:hypothetical protein